MKKAPLIVLLLLVVSDIFSQITFEKGYFINNEGTRVECLIKNSDWGYNPAQFEYKTDSASAPAELMASAVREFGIQRSVKYVSALVTIDRSPSETSKLSNSPNPILSEERIFLKVLAEGKANLYYYGDSHIKRFFYNIDDSPIEQLLFRQYRNLQNKVIENTRFRQQLWNRLSCATIERTRFERLEYRKKELVDLFIDYNACNGGTSLTFDDKVRRQRIALTIRPRLTHQSFTASNLMDRSQFNWGTTNSLSIGLEGEFYLPFNKNKWSLIIEPAYQKFNGETTSRDYSNPNSILVGSIDYQVIELSSGIRHYFFLSQKSRIFLNASFSYDIYTQPSSLRVSTKSGYPISTLDVNDMGISSLLFGAGFKADPFSIEFRYQTTRDPLSRYMSWTSEFKNTSIILGFSIFHKKNTD